MAVLSAPLSTREGVGVSLYVDDIKDICEDTCGGDTCASAVALYHERVGVIALGVEYDDVVAALEFGEGSVESHFFKAHSAFNGNGNVNVNDTRAWLATIRCATIRTCGATITIPLNQRSVLNF